ncbi:MAG: hypothetical protein AMJ79_07285 [Phycisphaerae bacterium SM23_30]|nr:MAG: hypothetical protein AMJ79_07285 [Phycisphaerae bacterium SM23_30]
MRLDISQQMKMDQRMVLAPRMIQSMEILQLPILALQERIEQEMLTNPVLEQEEPEGEGSDDSRSPEGASGADEELEGERTLQIAEDNSKIREFARLDNLGDDFDDYLRRSSYVQPRRGGDERDRKWEAMQNTAAPTKSLNEYLHEQWVFVECEEIIQKIGAVIIDHIDESGYLSAELPSLAEKVRAPVEAEQLEAALALVQTLEPTGVGARNIVECMLIQLQSNSEDRSLEIDLIENHLKDLEMNRYPSVAQKTGRSVAEIKKAVEVISHLDPRPGLQVGRRETPYIIPDVIVMYDEDNDCYSAQLSEGSTPSLRISRMYVDMIKKGGLPSDAKEFLQNNIRSARWLIESIEQRKSTLLRVVLGIHVATVSRAVSGKYLQTPTGIYPLRYFFSGGTETTAGESVSWDAIKAKLQEIVDNEDKTNPYSDDKLVEELARQGMNVARRTVAKYRSTLRIPPARRRKRFD